MRIGIDLGGTKIEAVLMAEDGSIVNRRRVKTPAGNYAAILDQLVQLVEELEHSYSTRASIGVATPGSLSRVSGRMKNCNSTCLNDRPLLTDIERRLKREVRLANDADCFALSEATDGAGQGFATVFGVILGTGVGAGICRNAQLVTGPNGIAGEWGHNAMPPLQGAFEEQQLAARNCYCGRRNCVETYLSGPGFEDGYAAATGKTLSVDQIVTEAEAGEEGACAHLDFYQECLASALGSVINLLDPHVIVLGGGLSNIASLYVEIPKRWCKYVFSDSCETLLSPPKYGDSSGVRGAAWLW